MALLGFVINPIISFCLVNLILISAFITDIMLTTKYISFSIKRQGDSKLLVNATEWISFEIYNKGKYILDIELEDELPDFHFQAQHPKMHARIESGKRVRVGYEMLPQKRGAFEFDHVHLKVKGRLGLFYKYFKVSLKNEYKVYPNLQAAKEYHLSMYRNMLEREEKKVVKCHGQGTAFESLREYVSGDEYRNINWAASARSNKLIVNQYEPEKNQRIYAFIDTGRALSYTLRGQNKLDRAINTSLVLSDVVNRNGDMSGLLCFNEQIQSFVSPGKGTNHRDKMMETVYHLESSKATSNFEDAFLYFRNKERRRSIIFLFTDFECYEEADIIAKAASVIEKQHILVVVLMRNLDIEEIANREVVTEEEIYNKAVALELLQERRRGIARLNRNNVMCIEIKSEQLQLSVIKKYIEVKNKLGI